MGKVKDRLKNLAKPLSVGPKILLMTSTSSLDPESAGAIESLIESLKIHHTILLVTHQREQAEKVSDNFIFCNIIR